MPRTGSLIDQFSDWPPSPPDPEELLKAFDMTPEKLRDAVNKYWHIMERVESWKEFPRLFEIPPEGAIELDICDWKTVHASDLSDVEIDLIQGEIEIERNGTKISQTPDELTYPLLINGLVRIHGTQNNTYVTVTHP